MKIWLKRIIAVALAATGTVLFLGQIRQLLDWPHLYPDLGQLHGRNLIFLGLTLLLAGSAWVAGAFLILDNRDQLWRLLLPALVFGLALFLGTLTAREAVGTIPCSYTTSMAAYREEFAPKDFRVEGRYLYPLRLTGEVEGYAHYQKEEVFSESVTVSYEKEEFEAEIARLKALGLDSFLVKNDVTCYQVELGGVTWQVLVTVKDKTVAYLRFNQPDLLPSFAPQPIQEPEEPVL